MKTKYPLEKYEEMYKHFDGGHDPIHMQTVREFAVKLAQIYAPDKVEIAYISATLHDIGLSISRENHEIDGYNLVKEDQLLKEIYGEEDFNLILEGIREHRCSTGNPQSIIAKIVSDSDNVSDTTKESLVRAYKYGLDHFPELTQDQQIERAAKHLHDRFTGDGSGTRLYFEESRQRLKETYGPISKAYLKGDIQTLKNIMEL